MVIPRTYGRLGNFLFQVAATIGYAMRHGLEYSVPSTTDDPKWSPVYLPHLINPDFDASLPEVRVVERGHAYQEIPFKEAWREKNIVLDGYWQSEKYFAEHRAVVLDAFAYPWTLKPGTVSVHVRRGDYVKLAHKHPPLPPEWYNAAMALFPGAKFEFYSDDIPYCRQHWGQRKDCSFSDGRKEEADLAAMSGCEHQICSASTFAWWGGWLNRNSDKRIVMPKRWFTEAEDKKCDTRDIVPASWERI